MGITTPDKGNPNVFTTFKGRFHLETATVGVWGTNLVTNGDFSNGETGWIFNVLTRSISGGKIRLTATGTSPRMSQYVALISGHKFYIGINYQKISGTVTELAFSAQNDAFAFATSVIPNGSPNRKSAVVTPSITASTSVRFLYLLAGAAIGDVIDFWSPVCIDLTAAFGAGNEPTAEQMDAYLAAYPNSWFDGSALLTTSDTPSHPVDSDVVMLSCTNDVQPIGDWTLTDYVQGATFATLPVECIPGKEVRVPVVVDDSIEILSVQTDGSMSLNATHDRGIVYLSGINFNISDNWY